MPDEIPQPRVTAERVQAELERRFPHHRSMAPDELSTQFRQIRDEMLGDLARTLRQKAWLTAEFVSDLTEELSMLTSVSEVNAVHDALRQLAGNNSNQH